MRYERPMIVGRDAVQALLGDTFKSDQSTDGTPASDVHAKEHIVPVTW